MDNSWSFFNSASSLIVSLPSLSSFCTLFLHSHLILYEFFHLLWASLHINIVSDCSVTVNIHYIFRKLICFHINICINKWSLLFQVSAVIGIAGKLMGIRAIKSAYIYSFKNKLTTWPLFCFLWIFQCLGRHCPACMSCICARFWSFVSLEFASLFISDCVCTQTRPSASHRVPPPPGIRLLTTIPFTFSLLCSMGICLFHTNWTW